MGSDADGDTADDDTDTSAAEDERGCEDETESETGGDKTVAKTGEFLHALQNTQILLQAM